MIPVVKTIDEIREYVNKWHKEGLSVGLVPTMGYLHEGHKSLIDRAVSENDRVVVSDPVRTERGSGGVSARYRKGCCAVRICRRGGGIQSRARGDV